MFESDVDPFPGYPHKFPLVRERDRTKAEKEAEGHSLDFQQTALVDLGFVWDTWIPLEMARRWKSRIYPLTCSTDSVQQWQKYLRQCMGLAAAAARRSAESDDRVAHKRTAQAIEEIFQSDLELLRKHFPSLNALGGTLAHSDTVPVEMAPQYVTLDQMAAVVHRSKRTLEKLKPRTLNPLPDPDIEGGGGKPDEWEWSRIRPWLESEYGRKLPPHFPASQFLPNLTETDRS